MKLQNERSEVNNKLQKHKIIYLSFDGEGECFRLPFFFLLEL